MGTVTGKDASVCIYSGSAKTHSVWGLSDFSLTFDRGTVEQELVGETGNWFDYGALSAEGSFTNCKFAASGNHDPLSSIIDSCFLTVSGNTGSNLSWFLVSCQATSWDVSFGDADTITESSVDFTVMDPYNITIDTGTGRITDA